MKTIVITIALLLFTSNVLAGPNDHYTSKWFSSKSPVTTVTDSDDNSYQVKSRVVCVDGYQYLYTWKGHSYSSPSVIQMFQQHKANNKSTPTSLPIKCTN